MSSWIADFNNDGVYKLNGLKAKVRSQCKLGRHVLRLDDPAVWLRYPLGLSCFPCAEPVDPAAVAAERARLAAPAPKVPAPRRRPGPPKSELVHGTPGAYTNHKCRCDPCTAANSRRSAAYRARRRGRQAVGV